MIYITLTTVPDRLNFENSAKQNIQSLLNQKTDKKFKVLYNIPIIYKEMEVEYKIPSWLTDIAESDDKLIINRVSDYGPVTKLIGALLYTSLSEDIILVCDDDHVYHEDMLEYHLKKQTQYPHAAIAFRGDRLYEKREWVEDGVKKHIYVNVPDSFPVLKDYNLAITGHWHSVSYKRSMFKDDFFEQNFLSKHWSDDILIAYYAIKHKLEIKCVHWDKETDTRLINYFGRDCNTFPVVKNLPFESGTGCHVLRYKTGTLMTDQSTYPQEWVNEIFKYYDTFTVHE